MSQDTVWTVVRYLMLLAGGFLVNKGVTTEEQWTSVVGAVGAIFAFAWGIYVRWNTKAVPTPVAKRDELPVASSLTGQVKQEEAGMSIFDFIPVAFKIIHRKEDIARAWEMVQPLIAEWNKVAPILVPLVKDIINDIEPELLEPGGAQTFDTAWVQETLNMLYGMNLVVDGKAGELTEAAIRRFQQEHGIKVDGDAGAVTRAWLYVQRQKLG